LAGWIRSVRNSLLLLLLLGHKEPFKEFKEEDNTFYYLDNITDQLFLLLYLHQTCRHTE